MSEAEVVRSLFVTLKRSFLGTPWNHRRIIQSLGFSKRHQCLEKPNNSSVRGMLMKVPHMVVVETDRMFYLRNMKRHHEQLTRAPVTVHHHGPPLPTADSGPHTLHAPMPAPSMRQSAFVQRQLAEHVLPAGMEGYLQNRQPSKQIKYQYEAEKRLKSEVLSTHGMYSRRSMVLHQQQMMRVREDEERALRQRGKQQAQRAQQGQRAKQ